LHQVFVRHSHAPILKSFKLQARATITDYTQFVTIEPGKRSGKPCVRGTRITVYDVLGYMAAGMSHEEILADFPSLTQDDLLACLAFAADGERRVPHISLF